MIRWECTVSRALVALLLTAVIAGGCATGSAGNPSTPRGVSPPTMLSTNRPDLKFPSRPANGPVLDLRISVEVDSLGQPNLQTLQVTGLGAADNRDVIERWVQTARFQPARQGGAAVGGVYKTRVRVEAQTRTVRGG